jgi:asparagine synthase (glutamine-hydrolysing)
MNGIGGIMKGAPNEAMLAQMKKGGQYISSQVSLFGSPQPVVGTMGQRTYVLVCDGELYNKDELINELSTLGYRFADRSCAAVLLHGFMAWGMGCLDKTLGVFALAVWDGEQLVLARDRLGYKPLFYSGDAQGFVFASSIRTLLRHPGIKPTLTHQGVAELMLLGPGRTPGCGILRGINELKPGHYIIYRPGTAPQLHGYWKLKAKPHVDDLDTSGKTVRELLTDATGRQGKSTGVMLSGGLDSSILAVLAKSNETFSLDYIDNDKHFTPDDYQPTEDAPYIKEMSQFLRSNHRRHMIGTDDLADALIPAMEARGLPGMGDIDAAMLLFCKDIRETAPIVLSGEGADEIFGGYPWYTDEEKRDTNTFPWSQSLQHRLSVIRPGALGNIDPGEYVRTRYNETINAAPTLYDDDPTDKRIRQLFLLNLQWFLQTLAARTESMANAADLTVRLPYLDHRLVEYLYNVPWASKHFGDNEKGLLRHAFKGTLPENILKRKKSPFPKTHNPAYLRKLQDMFLDLLKTPNAPLFEIINRKQIQEASTPWYGQLMTQAQTLAYLIQINAWLIYFSVDITL